jgi:hypothetical protein
MQKIKIYHVDFTESSYMSATLASFKGSLLLQLGCIVFSNPLHISHTKGNFIIVFYFQRAVIAQSVQRLGCGLDDRGSRVRFPAGTGNFSLHHRVQNSSGVHPAYQMGTRGSFPVGETAGV